VTAEHAAVIAANADALVAFGPEIAKGFYDTLYGHGPTEEIFHEGERPMREQTLIGWWERTARGPIDDDYWAWMAMVGRTVCSFPKVIAPGSSRASKGSPR